MCYRKDQEDLFKEVSYFATKANAKEILHVLAKVVEEMDPKAMDEDIHYDVHVRATLAVLWEMMVTYSRNKPQQKRMMKLWEELKEVLG